MNVIKNRPFIALTIFYCAVLIALNCRGFFLSPPKHDIARFIDPYAIEITGTVTGTPEQKINKQIFSVKVSGADGDPCGGTLLVHSYSKSAPAEEGDVVRFYSVLMRPPPSKNPGVFDYAAYLRQMNIYAVAYISHFEKIGHESQPFYMRLAQAAHTDMVETIQKALPSAESGVLIPMLIGDKQSLTNEEKRAFTNAGVMHTLVVSGFNVAYVAGIFILLFRVAGFKRKYASLLTMPFLILYLFVTGYSPPALRATVMAFCIILSMSLNRDSYIYQSLALAAAVILVFNPQALFNASFQLSFAATIGIVYLYPFLMEPFEKFPRWLRDTVCATTAVSLAAQLAVMPILAYYFNRVSLAGLVSNIPIVPLTGFVTGAGIILYLSHFVSAQLTWLIAFFTSLLMKVILILVHYFAGLPYATTHVGTPKLWFICVYYIFLWAIVQVRRIKYMPLILAVSGALIVAGLFINHHAENNMLVITSLYAGNGTAVHVAFPGNRNWLIDCGRQRDGARTICPFLWSEGIRKIDKIVVTSDDKSHSGGLQAVADNFPVSEVILPSSVTKQEQYFINGSTVAIIPFKVNKELLLTLIIDYAGKRIVFVHQEGIPGELTGTSEDILHISCRRKQADISACINSFKPGSVILSGTVPKDMPEAGNVYALNRCGAVSTAVTSKGVDIEKHIKGKYSANNEDGD